MGVLDDYKAELEAKRAAIAVKEQEAEALHAELRAYKADKKWALCEGLVLRLGDDGTYWLCFADASDRQITQGRIQELLDTLYYEFEMRPTPEESEEPKI